MERRDFLKGAAVLAVAAGVAGKLGGAEKRGGASETEGKSPDLVALRGESPADMFDTGITLFGGIQAFVKPGQSVVIKPNIGWDRPPESGANANPGLVGRMVKRCFEAGAKEVFVFDHTCDNWVNSYSTSGIKAAVEAEGGTMVSGAVEEDYREIDVPKALRMKRPKVHRLILDCDVFFNVPVLKHHGGAKLTCAMKNFMGLVWDRRFMHANDLQQCIADASLIRRPDLNVVDAFRVMSTGGPRGNANSVVRNMKSLLLSRDIVAVDTAGARLIGFPLETIAHIRNAEKLGLGTTKLNTLDIRRIML
ncbi:DUF362 domain-containing protein [uncultured Victivallis sp.]|uniref:DUF362 domain-containing protein n=1 Tax=uncultured Victivallis sp. TaxID=354118 RepID=UPI0025D9B5E8|nr:DUF362 domain-containing protein [uncultured Victivallis sp.]